MERNIFEKHEGMNDRLNRYGMSIITATAPCVFR